MIRLRDIMSADVVTVTPETNLRDAMALFASRHVSGAPVVTGRKVLGVVSTTDLMDFVASLPTAAGRRNGGMWEMGDARDESQTSQRFFTDEWNGSDDALQRWRESGAPEWDALAEYSVADAMTRDVVWLPPETPVDRAAQHMRTAGVHRVLVMQYNKLLGIVTTRDIADAVADHRLTARRYVFTTKNATPDFEER